VDAPPDLGGKLLIGIEDVTPNPVTHLIYSHAHADHIGSAHLLQRDGVTIIAHQLTARLLKDANDDNRPLPNETFSGTRSELRIDGNRLILEYTGDWHQAGNLFIHLPDQKILTAIDSLERRSNPDLMDRSRIICLPRRVRVAASRSCTRAGLPGRTRAVSMAGWQATARARS
jgi:glyoxylase-like metal-dependent hydrolase (beta-lactamase superfamily II)